MLIRSKYKVFPGDKVKCIIKASDRAKIIEVIERNTKEVKGILDFQKKKYCLNSVDGSYQLNIIIDSKVSKSKNNTCSVPATPGRLCRPAPALKIDAF